VDDYAHHPAEVAATLAAARGEGPGRVVAVFQPHLPSRTRALWRDLGEALGAADLVVVTDVYLAREPADPSATGRLVAEAVPTGPPVSYVPRPADVPAALAPALRPGDLVLTLGAGDITSIGQEILDRVEKRTPDARVEPGAPDGA
jgi:UDP-N-acetylmuramate--alanine ligase